MPQRNAVSRLIRQQAAARGPAPYLKDARSSRSLNYDQLAAATWAVGDRLVELGTGPGAAVLIDLEDPLSSAVGILGVLAAGRCAVPIDPHAPAAARERIVRRAAPRAIIGTRDPAAPGHLPALPAAELEMIIDRPTAPDAPRAGSSPGLLQLHTSGSTGEPKAVRLTDDQLLHTARAVAEQHRLTTSDRGYSPLPLFHINAEVVGVLATLVAGAAVVLDDRFHRHGFWDLMRSEAVTWINGVPAIWSILARDDGSAGDPRPTDVRFLRSASAPLPALVRDLIEDRAGVPVLESYGMTEAASQIAVAPLDEPTPPGSCGRPAGVEVQIRDRTGCAAPTGATGSVWIRGRSVITGFVGGMAADRFDADHWLDTGDLGHFDDRGFLYLAGRSDDVINRGGELIYPREVEEVMLGDPAVAEAVVVGRADPVLGQIPIGYVIPAEQIDAEALDQLRERLHQRCAEQLSRYQRPAAIHLVEGLPRATTGKVQRRLLSELRR